MRQTFIETEENGVRISLYVCDACKTEHRGIPSAWWVVLFAENGVNTYRLTEMNEAKNAAHACSPQCAAVMVGNHLEEVTADRVLGKMGVETEKERDEGYLRNTQQTPRDVEVLKKMIEDAKEHARKEAQKMPKWGAR